MRFKQPIFVIGLTAALCLAPAVYAADPGGMAQTADMLSEKHKIDGYIVIFQAMKAQPGKEMGGTHDFMIKVEKDGKAVTGLAVNSKVVHPGGKAETKMMMPMGEWYMAGYDLGHPGKHQLMVLFKTADGAKHSGGVFYPSN